MWSESDWCRSQQQKIQNVQCHSQLIIYSVCNFHGALFSSDLSKPCASFQSLKMEFPIRWNTYFFSGDWHLKECSVLFWHAVQHTSKLTSTLTKLRRIFLQACLVCWVEGGLLSHKRLRFSHTETLCPPSLRGLSGDTNQEASVTREWGERESETSERGRETETIERGREWDKRTRERARQANSRTDSWPALPAYWRAGPGSSGREFKRRRSKRWRMHVRMRSYRTADNDLSPLPLCLWVCETETETEKNIYSKKKNTMEFLLKKQ